MKVGQAILLALAVVLLSLALTACSDPTPTLPPTATPTVASIPSPTPTESGALPTFPSVSVDDKFGATIQVLESGGYELSIFATPDDLARVSSIRASFPDGSRQMLEAGDDTWGLQWLETLLPGTYVFEVTLNDGTTFQKSYPYAGDGP